MSIYSLQLSAPFLKKWSPFATPNTDTTPHPRKSAHCSPKVALNISTNVLRPPLHASSHKHAHSKQHPHLRVVASSKASATVSLTNANASATSIASESLPSSGGLPGNELTNSIPFPSAPIVFQSSRDNVPHDFDYDSESYVMVDAGVREYPCVNSSGRDSPTAWHIDLRRRRGRSCLASSYVHSDSVDSPTRPATPPGLSSTPSAGSVSAGGTPAPLHPIGKRPRTADLQFIALMHRSLANHLRSLLTVSGPELGETGMDTLSGRCDIVLEQDLLLVERLWCSLVEQGFKPILLHDAVPSESIPKMPGTELPVSDQDMIIPSSPILSSTNKVVNSELMTVSQLVASLILRTNDRRATRTRSSRFKRSSIPNARQTTRSPLHQVVSETYDLDEFDL
ncbi:unnamed protein product [Somion occarium]|uniref:Uncharacterized protein n=1 Tax=Somion occarium TaxID=3059160 RepID=A0ABP1D7G7_9APHY